MHLLVRHRSFERALPTFESIFVRKAVNLWISKFESMTSTLKELNELIVKRQKHHLPRLFLNSKLLERRIREGGEEQRYSQSLQNQNHVPEKHSIFHAGSYSDFLKLSCLCRLNKEIIYSLVYELLTRYHPFNFPVTVDLEKLWTLKLETNSSKWRYIFN